MANRLQPIIKEIDKLSDALDMERNEFSQRAMRSSILSTSYSLTGKAIERHKVNYHRALNLKLGIAIAQVFETIGNRFNGAIPLDIFLDKTTNSYMRICGIPFFDRINKHSSIKGQVVWKLQRSLEHHLIEIATKSNSKFVKMYPDASSITFAMLMNPETMLRSPYVKAMAQTIGGMSLVDKEQKKLTVSDLSIAVQDKLHSRHLLEATKSATIFAASHVDPFHTRKKVSFYSEADDKLFILPTFPITGVSTSLSDLPPIMSAELAYELNSANLGDLTDGMEPPLISINGGDKTFYFNRQFPYIKALEDLLGAKFNRYIPKNESALSGLGEIQSKLGKDFGDGIKVAKFLNDILNDKLKDSELNEFERKIMSVLLMRLELVKREEKGFYMPIEDEVEILKTIKGLCEITNPTGKILSEVCLGDKK